jgi:simple sugar transport system substrate-binding protein
MAAVMLGALCAVGVAACGSSGRSPSTGSATRTGKPVKIAMVCGTPAADPYLAPLEQGAKDAGRELGITLDYTGIGADATPASMAQLVQVAINQHPDALVICNWFSDATSPLIRKAVAQGIPVVNSDGGYDGATKAGAFANVGQSDALAGEQAGQKLIASGVTQLLCVNHSPANPSTAARCAGAQSAFKAKGLSTKILNLTQQQLADTTAQAAAIKGTLAADHGINGILMLGPSQGVAALSAVQSSGLQGKVKVGTFDTSSVLLQDIKKGTLEFAIWQQPYLHGYLPVVLAATYVRHFEVTPTSFVNTGPVFITKENIDRIMSATKAGVA